MRLDKFLAEVGLGSRKEVKQLIKKDRSRSMSSSRNRIKSKLIRRRTV